MPILTPSYLPPPPGLGSPSHSCASSNATCLSAPRSQPPSPPTSPEQDAVSQRSDIPLKQEHALKIPFIKLDVPAIQDDMAASLAVALLGHVLFLKSQVPLCVAPLILSYNQLIPLANFNFFQVLLHSSDASLAHHPHPHPYRARPRNART
jgi:hypothetical protein